MKALHVGALLLLAGCTTTPRAPQPPLPREAREAVPELRPEPLPLGGVTLTPEPRNVEGHWIVDLYGFLRPTRHEAFLVQFPGSDGTRARAHLLLPPGRGPHPAVLVYPIRGGSHVVSEGLAQALVNRGYAALRIERRTLFPRNEESPDFSASAQRLRHSLLDGRRLLDWLERQPGIDPERLAVAGVSLGGILAATLMGVDDRLQAGLFIMAGGGLPELLFDSSEGRLQEVRERILDGRPDPSREAFLASVRDLTTPLDPLTYARRIDPERVVLVSGRFDSVVPPERTRALWEALGRPTWHRFPAGHYQALPFFWWAVGRGADLLDEVFGRK